VIKSLFRADGYTTLDEIDLFADKVLDAAKKGIPA